MVLHQRNLVWWAFCVGLVLAAVPASAQDTYLGSSLEYGVNNGGSLIQSGVGFRATGEDDWIITPPGHEAWAVEWSSGPASHDLANSAPEGSDDITLTLVESTSTGATFTTVQSASSDDLDIEQTVTHDTATNYVHVAVRLTNSGVGTIDTLTYMRSINPEPDLGPRSILPTHNNVLNDALEAVVITAEGPITGRTLVMLTTDATAIGSVHLSPYPTSAADIIADPLDPNGRAADSALFLVWNLGIVAAGTTVELGFWYGAAVDLDGAFAIADGLGVTIEGFSDRDGDGVPVPADCDDTRATVYPGAEEICDDLDNDCDEEIDEGLAVVYYRDNDGDGFGDRDVSRDVLCEDPPEHWVSVGGDCDDNFPEINPDAEELCDEIDNDCDDEIDEDGACGGDGDADGDGDSDSDADADGGGDADADGDGDVDIDGGYIPPPIEDGEDCSCRAPGNAGAGGSTALIALIGLCALALLFRPRS